MNILYHHRTMGDGAEGIHIREMIAAFREQGHTVEVVALVGEQERGQATGGKSRWNWISRYLPAGAYELAEIGYNVVGRRAVDKAIQRCRPDFIYDRYNSFCTAAVRAGRHHGIPTILEVNAPMALERSVYDGHRLRLPGLAAKYERSIFASADLILVVSTPLKEYLIEHRDVPSSKILVLPNGANPLAFSAQRDDTDVRERLKLGGRTVIGFVGILRPWHGLDLLLDAFTGIARRRPDVHLLLVGDGPMEATLKTNVSERNLADRVSFTGRVRHQEVAEYITAMDIAVSPRATFYASPMKILEYMAVGLPTLAPNTPNIRDIIRNGEDGVLFEPENVESLEKSLDSLLDSRELRTSIGHQARKRIENELNWHNNASKVLQVVQQLMSARTR